MLDGAIVPAQPDGIGVKRQQPMRRRRKRSECCAAAIAGCSTGGLNTTLYTDDLKSGFVSPGGQLLCDTTKARGSGNRCPQPDGGQLTGDGCTIGECTVEPSSVHACCSVIDPTKASVVGLTLKQQPCELSVG